MDGVAPIMDDLKGDKVGAGSRVKFMSGTELLALANYVPGGHGKRPGEFELLKVFPLEKES